MNLKPFLLVKEIFRGIFKEKIQAISLLILTILSTMLITAAWTTDLRLKAEADTMHVETTKFEYTYPYQSSKVDFSSLSYFSTSYAAIYNSPAEQNSNATDVTQVNTTNALKLTDFDPIIYSGDHPWLKVNNNPSAPLEFNGNLLPADYTKTTNWYNLADKKYIFNMNAASVKNSLYGHLITAYQKADTNYQKVISQQIWQLLNSFFNIKNNLPHEIFKIPFSEYTKHLKSSNDASDASLPGFVTYVKDNKNKKASPTVVISEAKSTNVLTYDDFAKGIEGGLNGYLIGLPYINKDLTFSNKLTADEFHTLLSDCNYIDDTYDPYAWSHDLRANYSFDFDPGTDSNNTTKIDELETLANVYGFATNYHPVIRRAFNAWDYKQNVDYHVININPITSTGAKAPNALIDHLEIFEGYKPLDKSGVIISPQYARYHGIKPGDVMQIGYKNVVVTGIGGDPWMMYPLINDTDFLPNTRNQAVIYVLNDLYYDFDFFNNHSYEQKLSDQRTDFSQVFYQKIPGFNYDDQDQYLLTKLINFNNNRFDLYSKNLATPGKPRFKPSYHGVMFAGYNDQLASTERLRTSSLAGVQRIFTIVVIVFSIIVIIVTAFAQVLIIRGSIHRQSEQLGVLKSLGYRTSQLTLAYWTYALFVSVIAIPIGWILGLILQIPLTEIFNTVFILPYNIFSIEGLSLLISLGVLNLVLLTAITWVAIYYLKVPTLSLLHYRRQVYVPGVYARYQHHLTTWPFKARLLAILAATNARKLLVMFLVMLVSSFIISIMLALPMTINTLGDNYFKNFHAETVYDLNEPVAGDFASRLQAMPWEGIDYKLPEKSNAYQKLIYPIDPGFPSTPYIMDPDYPNQTVNVRDWINSLITGTDDANDKLHNLHLVDALFQDIPWVYTSLNGRAIAQSFIDTLQAALKQYGNKAESLANIACTIVGQIDKDATAKTGPDCLTYELNSLLPPQIKAYYERSPQVKNRFAVSHMTVPFNPNKDEFATSYQSVLYNQASDFSHNNLPLVKTYGLLPDTKMISIDKNLKSEWSKDWATIKTDAEKKKEIEIPILVNRPLANDLDLKSGQTLDFYPQYKTLKFKAAGATHSYLPVFNFKNWDYTANTANSIHQLSFDPATVDMSQFFYYPDNDQAKNKFTGRMDKAGKILPLSPNNVSYGDGSKTILDALNYNQFGYDRSAVSRSSILSNPEAQKYPYKIFMRTGSTWNKYNFVGEGINFLISKEKYSNWWRQAIQNDFLKVEPLLSTSSLSSLLKDSNYFYNNEKNDYNVDYNFKYKIVGIQNSYGDPTIFVNQNIANNLLHYPTKKLNETISTPFQVPEMDRQYAWFNTRFSLNPEPVDLSTRLGVHVNAGLGFTKDAGGVSLIPDLGSMNLFATTHELIDKFTEISLAIIAILVTIIITCAAILVAMITNLLLSQFQNLIAVMKTEGYRPYEINLLTISIFSPGTVIAFAIGFGVGWAVFLSLAKYIASMFNFLIPITFTWYLIFIALAVILGIYGLSYLVSILMQRRLKLADMVKMNSI